MSEATEATVEVAMAAEATTAMAAEVRAAAARAVAIRLRQCRSTLRSRNPAGSSEHSRELRVPRRTSCGGKGWRTRRVVAAKAVGVVVEVT